MKKILMVDDEADLAVLIQQKFRHEIAEKVYQFFFARHGQEALKILEKNPDIQVLLTDINMPEMDGYELLLHVRQHYPRVHIIVLSAYSDSQTISQALAHGAHEFLPKPLNFKDMKEKMDHFKN